MAPRRIIIDTDPGQDDAFAILFALGSPGELDVVALTTVGGNVPVEKTSYNARQIVELAGRPIAYLQSYDPHLEDGHPYADQPFGTLGIDISIGPAEMVGIGHGSAIVRQFVEELFDEGAPRVVIDPHPDNKRAIRAYEKAGFREIDRRSSIYGDAVLMAIDAEGEDI